MKLYYSPGACSLWPHIVAREAGLDVALCKVNLKSHQLEDGSNFFDINPKGSVPALQLETGEILTEGLAVAQFLAEQNPAANLMPEPGSMAYYRLLEWVNFFSSEVHKSFVPFFWQGSDAEKAAAMETLHKYFSYIEKQLTGDYLLGNQLSIADAYLFVIDRWNGVSGVDTSAWRNLTAFSERLAERPAVHDALKAEGLLD
ncbi:MAG: glutathione transferase GstA [Gammaproteobacteria bacterium]|nr:glutathione transferase GstA [Gammaproteobacteria bacterium]